MYAIERKENFERELTALLTMIDDLKDSTRSMIGTNQGLPSRSAINKLNRLKLQGFKLKERYFALIGMDQGEWEKNKLDFQKDFRAAKEAIATRVTIV